MELSRGDRMLTQRALNELTKSDLKADGVFGPMTYVAANKLRSQRNLPAQQDIGEDIWPILDAHICKRFVRDSDIVAAARSIGVLPSIVFAICEVEGSGVGSLSDGRPLILFERHKFYQYVKTRLGEKQGEDWKVKYPNICHPTWSQNAYQGGAGEYNRFEQARMLDATCAMLSTSWGMFQIMGFNFALAGYKDVQTFVQEMIASEQNHLKAVLGFFKSQPALYSALKARDYNNIARLYNGASYATHGYHTRLKTADERNLRFNSQ